LGSIFSRRHQNANIRFDPSHGRRDIITVGIGQWISQPSTSILTVLGEIPAEYYCDDRTEIWHKGNNSDGNRSVWDSRELDEADKPSNAEDGVARPERCSKATSTTAERRGEARPKYVAWRVS
jgi:hypothetical protein